MTIRDQIKSAIMDFAFAYGLPGHLDCENDIGRLIDIYTRELSKHYTNQSVKNGIDIAWSKSRRFPAVADFFEGFGGKERTNQTAEELLKGYK